jgi:hypothetical protein
MLRKAWHVLRLRCQYHVCGQGLRIPTRTGSRDRSQSGTSVEKHAGLGMARHPITQSVRWRPDELTVWTTSRPLSRPQSLSSQYFDVGTSLHSEGLLRNSDKSELCDSRVRVMVFRGIPSRACQRCRDRRLKVYIL